MAQAADACLSSVLTALHPPTWLCRYWQERVVEKKLKKGGFDLQRFQYLCKLRDSYQHYASQQAAPRKEVKQE